MIETALAQTDTFWQVTLGIGAVVILVVVVLMTLLLHFVRRIDRRVELVGQAAKGVAGNTAALDQLPLTASVLRDIREEALIHNQFLQSL